jgi:hypothetical protein
MKPNRPPTPSNFLAILMAVVFIISAATGCGQRSAPVGTETVLATWEQGDEATAVSDFLATDWSAGPLFTPDSGLSLSEDQFKQLPAIERDARIADVHAQLAALNKLAGAVAQAGREAAAKKDLALARKHFAALQQLGQAIDGSDSMLIVRMMGQVLEKMGKAEMEKLPQG